MQTIIFDFYGVIFNPATHQPMAGLIQFLEKLKQHQINCGVASSSDSSSIKLFLLEYKLDKYFHVIIGADKVTNLKPDPECYQGVADYFGTAPADCVVIDDSAQAIESAKQAGFTTVYFAPAPHGLDNFEKIATLLGL